MALAIVNCAAGLGKNLPLSVVCVGTDRSTGDSLGPLTGTMLFNAGFRGHLWGTLDAPVHAENLSLIHPKTQKPDTLLIGVDACLGSNKDIGCVMVRTGPLKPGLGVRKKLQPLGDLHIAGVVNIGGFMEYAVLQNTRLSLVVKMAQIIAAGLLKADVLLRGTNWESITKAPERLTLEEKDMALQISLLPWEIAQWLL